LRRSPALAAAALLLLTACGAGGGESDLQVVASAIREVESKGAGFTFSETLTQTGGDIPKGKMAQVKFNASGQEQDDTVNLVLKLSNSGGQAGGAYDLVIADSDLYVRPHGSTRAWFQGPASVANHFYPGVRLNLLRETVLLATKVSKTTSYSNGGFSDQYTVTPGSDQLEQLQSTVVGAAQEAKFLKSATGSITFFVSTSGHRLQRVDLNVSGTDPQSSLKQVFTSSLTFSKVGKVPAPKVPAAAIAVQAQDLFSTADTPPSQG
jgi:hypothetical protein